MNEMGDTTARSLVVDFQVALDEMPEHVPSAELIEQWAQRSYQLIDSTSLAATAEVTIRIVAEPEMAQLNEAYRGKQGTTNVLSFPFELDMPFDPAGEEALEWPLLGDIVVCHEVVRHEAEQQSKQLMHHYAHMVVHGVLHLCGYDHQLDEQALIMESLETKILASLEIPNPYQ